MRIVLIVVFVACLPEAIVHSQVPSRIVLTRPASGRLGDLWIFEKGRERRLTQSGKDGIASWSPDGRLIAFFAKRGSTRGELMVIEVDGSGSKLLAEMAAPWKPEWSPDGTKLLFPAWIHGDPSDIYVVDAAGGNLRRLTHKSGRSPSWSPDGRRIAYMAFANDGEHDGVCLIDASGGNHRRVADSPARDSTPRWSPDGQHLVYQWYESLPGRVRGEVRVVALPDDDATPTEPKRISEVGSSAWGGAWSPSGQQIAFVSAKSNAYALCVARLDGSELRQIATAKHIDEQSLAWSNDGKRVFFACTIEDKREVHAVGSDGESRQKFAEGIDPDWSS